MDYSSGRLLRLPQSSMARLRGHDCGTGAGLGVGGSDSPGRPYETCRGVAIVSGFGHTGRYGGSNCRFDGSYRWFLIRGNPLKDEAGNIVRWYGTCLDIEDRKRGEEDLRASELSWREIVDSVPGLVATMGAMGEVAFLNRQTLEYFGKTNEELKNWALTDAIHPDDLPRI